MVCEFFSIRSISTLHSSFESIFAILFRDRVLFDFLRRMHCHCYYQRRLRNTTAKFRFLSCKRFRFVSLLLFGRQKRAAAASPEEIDFARLRVDRLTSRPRRLLGRLVTPSRCQKSARPLRASAPGLFRIRSKSRIPAAFGIENSLLHPRLDNIGATLGSHEAILPSYIFVVVGIDCFRARGVDPGSCHQLLGRRGLRIRQHRQTTARRTLRRRSETNSVRQQSCLPRSRLHRGRHRTGGH